MRERLAEILAALSTATVVVLAAVFSLLQNARGPEGASHDALRSAPQAPPARHAAGREVYSQHGCGGCHAIAGEGNPRAPLDGVGRRLEPEEIRQWIIAAEPVRPRLSASAARMKQSYETMPAQDLQALVDYLASLQSVAEPR